MEASSHGIDQRRLDGVRLAARRASPISAATISTITARPRPMRPRSCASSRRCCRSDAPAVINADGPYADVFLRRRAPPRPDAHHHRQRGRDPAPRRGARRGVRAGADGRGLRADHRDDPAAARRLPGRERASWPPASCWPWRARSRAAEVLEGFADLKGVSGRLEQVGEVDGALCIVDYAHKPDALAHVLDALRPFTDGTL